MSDTMIEQTSLIARMRDVKFDQLDDEFYAVDSKSGFFYNMNETGNRVWELISTPMSVDRLCARLQQEYRVDAATCLAQVTKILTQLREAGLIKVTDASTAQHASTAEVAPFDFV